CWWSGPPTQCRQWVIISSQTDYLENLGDMCMCPICSRHSSPTPYLSNASNPNVLTANFVRFSGEQVGVLHVLWSGKVGGAERAVYQLLRAQRQGSDFIPTMAYCQAEGYYADLLRKEDIEVISLDLRRGSDLHRLPVVKRKMEQFPIHHFHACELVPMLASANCPGATRIYTHRGGASSYPFRKALNYRAAGILLRCFFHSFSGNTQRACVSGPKVHGLPASGWEVTYNGLDFSLLTPRVPKEVVAQRHRMPMDGRPVIGTSANLRSWKRIDLLLQACAQMKDLQFTVLIVG